MPARELGCRVIEKKWITPTVVSLRFEPTRKLRFDPGQFLSVLVPQGYMLPPGSPGPIRAPLERAVRRVYSFASAPSPDGLELCVKVLPGGLGSNYLSSLRVGDTFRASAPFGDFRFEPRPDGDSRRACFIATGTGVAPFKSYIEARDWAEHRPHETLLLFGARTEDEVCYPGLFERAGLKVVNAISLAQAGTGSFKGRVSDYLASRPADWGWRSTDFYLCGNRTMVEEIRRYLIDARGVDTRAIHQEVYFASREYLGTPSVAATVFGGSKAA